MEEKYYIYKITNLVNGKVYIGETCTSVSDRFKRHLEKDNEEMKQARANAYAVEVDPLHFRKQRKIILEEWTEDDEREYILKVKELSDKIAKEYPYEAKKQ